MADFLLQMADASRARAQALRAATPFEKLRAAALVSPSPRPLRLRAFTLIAEVKRASPSEGRISTEPDSDAASFVAEQARRYQRGGAAIISVLTEPTCFAGDLAHAAAAARAVDTPVMRKDFLVDPAQVYEARLAGCSGVLLIVRMLSDDQLADMLRAAIDAHLFVLIEAFDGSELARARVLLERPEFAGKLAGLDTPANEARPFALVGINTRNLATLDVNHAALDGLLADFPPGYPRIAESGLSTPADAARAAAQGYQGALVGTALMRAPDPASLARAFLEAGAAHVDLRARLRPTARTRVKICGLTTRAAIDAAITAGADALGFVFAESPRRVTSDQARKLLEHIPPFIARVAVFKNPDRESARAALNAGIFSAVQSEHADAALFAELAPDLPFIHVHRVRDGVAEGLVRGDPDDQLRLIEGPRSGVGEAVDWSIPARYAHHHRVILAGGLNPDNIAEAIQCVRPFAVDVSSGVESSPGQKDPKKILAFLTTTRTIDRQLNDH